MKHFVYKGKCLYNYILERFTSETFEIEMYTLKWESFGYLKMYFYEILIL